MKRYILIFIVLVSSHTQSRAAQQADTPLTKAEIMDLVKFGMSSTELIAKINNLGIDFQPSDDDLEALRKAGAQEAVIQALRKANPRPLTREQIGQLVAGGVPSQRAALLVKQRGINFAADAEYLKALRLAGADDELIAALREASRSVPAELTVRTSPGAEVDLDGKPQGRADAQGAWTSKVDPGSHNLKVAMQGMKDFEKSLTLAPGKGIKVEAQLEAAGPAPGEVRTNPKDNLKYVWIPPGIFLMGCSPKDDECQADEKPAHEVTITKGFWMGRTEVTVGAYNHFADATNRKKPHLFLFIGDKKFLSDPKLPVVGVNWTDAHDFCAWSGGRLPTEAQWEYAARGGNSAPRYGDIDAISWYGANAQGSTHEVGLKRPNAFGLFDILGNDWEWVNDWYDPNYYKKSPSQDPPGPTSGTLRVLRGASWFDIPRTVRVSFRYKVGPGSYAYSYGFRCIQASLNP